MKRFCALLLILTILNIGVSVADAQKWIPDTNLRTVVREALDLTDGDNLRKAAMLDLTELVGAKRGISDLTGLEFATNLTELKLNNNSISDLSPLSGLENLTGLHIWSNDITDLSPIADLTSLEILRLTNNVDLDISDLSGLTNLKMLAMAHCSISDLSPLSGLVNLEWLRVDNNSISNLRPLSGLVNLTFLKLAGNPITNTKPLAGLVSNLTEPLDIVVFGDRNLEKLVRSDLRIEGLGSTEAVTPEYMEELTSIHGGGAGVIRDLSGLEYATNLQELTITYRIVKRSLTPLSGLAHLSRLILRGEVTELDVLSTLPSLRVLNLSSGTLTDVTLIGELTDLEQLTLSYNDIMDVSPLANLENLTYLYLQGNSSNIQNRNVSNTLSDISPLASLENLETLSLQWNAISDITPLAGLVELSDLTLADNKISDVSALENLVKLSTLDFRSNSVTDVSPLLGLLKLRRLYVENNPITNAGALYPLTQKRPRTGIDIDVPIPAVEVPDETLAASLRTELELADDADITVPDMLDITSLYYFPGINITDLTGLEYATNLTSLTLPGSPSASLTDLSPLQELTSLTRLELSGHSQLTDLEPLQGLVNLETLILQDDVNISDITPLAGLVNLTELNHQSNDISDVSPLMDLENLETLILSGNDISDVSPLAGLVNLELLSLSSNDISDVSPLSGLENLTTLFLTNNSIVDVSPLEDLVGLEKLYILGNSVTDTSPLEYITAELDIEVDRSVNMPDAVLAAKVRETLGLEADTPITKPDLKNLTELRYELLLNGAQLLSSITGLEHAKYLTLLQCQGSLSDGVPGITDITPLTGLVKLEELFLEFNTISNFTPLVGLTNLRTLSLNTNSISDISGLSGLTWLEILSLNVNDISDVSPLENLTNLEQLSLTNNNIQDITPLEPLLDNLTHLNLGVNPLMDTRILLSFDGDLDITPSLYPSWDVNADGSIDELDVQLVRDALGQDTAQPLESGGNVYGTPLAADVNQNGIVDSEDIAIVQSYIASDSVELEVDIDLEFRGLKSGPFGITIIFSGSVTGFGQDDVSFAGSAGTAEITSWSTEDNTIYTATVTPTVSVLGAASQRISISVPADVATDADGNANTASSVISVRVVGGEVVHVPDTNLAAAIRDDRPGGLSEDQSITTGLLLGLTQLTANNSEIVDLMGLEEATALTHLSLDNNSISNVSPLAGLTGLKVLKLVGNSLVDVSSLVDLTALIALDLRNNTISDISALASLRGLTSLYLEGNSISDTSPLYPLTQQDPPVDIDIEVVAPGVVSVPDTNLASTLRDILSLASDADITSGDMETLTDLTIPHAVVLSDLTGLEYAINLIRFSSQLPSQRLTVPGSETESLSDLSPLAELTSLTHLAVTNYPHLTDISPLENLAASLTELTLSWNNISDITPLTDLSNLTHLHLNNNDISDVSVLEDLTNLSELRLVGNPILDTSPLFPLTQQNPPVDIDIEVVAPEVVFVPDTGLASTLRDALRLASDADITSGDMETLTDLTIPHAVVLSDLTGLEYAINLTRLSNQLPSQRFTVSRSEEGLSDLSPLAELTSLTHLALANYPHLTDISPLEDLANLTELTLTWNNIIDLTVLSGLSNLTHLHLNNNDISDVSALEDLTNLSELRLVGNPILDTSPLYPLTQQSPAVDIDIAVSQYAPWDVNEDGNVDAIDAALVTDAIGQSGIDIADSRTDVDGDDDVDNDDLLLVTDNLDNPGSASPAALSGIVNLLDTATLEALDRDVLQGQLEILRAESDGSAKYQNAIALLEAFLAATRPEETVLLANYPNPFNPETWLPYHLANASNVRITIYDTRGVVVRRLDLGHQREGYYTSRSRAAYWDGRNHVGERVASGIYFYQLEADDVSRLRKMVILK